MTSILPISTVSYKSMPNFSTQGAMKAAAQPKAKTNQGAPKTDGAQSKKESLKKTAAITFGVCAFMAFVLSRNPSRNAIKNEYKEVFSKSYTDVQRSFKNMTLRDEVIIKEVVNGNETAKALIKSSKMQESAEDIVNYVKCVNKLGRMNKYYQDGRFDIFHHKGGTPANVRAEFYDSYRNLTKKAEGLYEKIKDYIA